MSEGTTNDGRSQSLILSDDFFTEEDSFFKEVPAQMIQGFFKTKHRLKVGNVNDFINKLRNTKLLPKFFSQSDIENRGIKLVIEEF